MKEEPTIEIILQEWQEKQRYTTPYQKIYSAHASVYAKEKFVFHHETNKFNEWDFKQKGDYQVAKVTSRLYEDIISYKNGRWLAPIEMKRVLLNANI